MYLRKYSHINIFNAYLLILQTKEHKLLNLTISSSKHNIIRVNHCIQFQVRRLMLRYDFVIKRRFDQLEKEKIYKLSFDLSDVRLYWRIRTNSPIKI